LHGVFKEFALIKNDLQNIPISILTLNLLLTVMLTIVKCCSN